jgi:hypothetical protein
MAVGHRRRARCRCRIAARRGASRRRTFRTTARRRP